MQTVSENDTPASRVRVYREFLNSWLWLCVPELPDGWKPGMTMLPAGMKISVVTPNNAKGDKVLPVFTEPAALANYDPNTPHLAFPAIEIFKMAVKLGVGEIMVNPFDPVRKPIRAGGTLTHREFEALALGMIPKQRSDGKGQVLTVEKPVKVQVGRCKDTLSAEVKSRLVEMAEHFPELEQIFRYRMRYVETGTESKVFGLVCSVKGDRFHEIVGNLMSNIQPLLIPDEYVDFTSLRMADMPLIRNHGELVYKRKAESGA